MAHKTWQRLDREARANPGKTAVLLLLAPLAAYLWWPLVSGWLGNEEGSSPPSAAASASPGAAAVGTAPELCVTLPWQEVARGLTDDPRRKPALELPEGRNPFDNAERQRQLATAEQPGKEQDPTNKKPDAADRALRAREDVTPLSAGLTLSTTMVGAHQGLAVVRGPLVVEGRPTRQQVVRQGDRLTVHHSEANVAKPADPKKPGAASPTTPATAIDFTTLMTFDVEQITEHALTLTRQGRRYRLTLAEAKPSGNIAIRDARERP